VPACRTLPRFSLPQPQIFADVFLPSKLDPESPPLFSHVCLFPSPRLGAPLPANNEAFAFPFFCVPKGPLMDQPIPLSRLLHSLLHACMQVMFFPSRISPPHPIARKLWPSIAPVPPFPREFGKNASLKPRPVLTRNEHSPFPSLYQL